MRIFVSYASEHRQIADRLALGLRGEGHEVFLDRDQLPPGEPYDSRIREAINLCDLMVFLISPESVAQGSYALTEMGFAREKWNSPAGHVLPVLVAHTKIDDVPPYLRAVTILSPSGELIAEVLGQIAKFSGRQNVILAGLSEDAKSLLEASDGQIGFLQFGMGASVVAGDTEFMIDPRSHREQVRWKAAIDELIMNKLLENPTSPRAEFFTMTKRGYDVADEIRAKTKTKP
ncbi:MAG: toll/interleukin-1 receptor domain-containing protein [Nitrospira sp. BO4]|jgi:hypothetical protein|nr:toll/interleukin-1 receptor domain-containing protein [Nitrospira sp. BO4]